MAISEDLKIMNVKNNKDGLVCLIQALESKGFLYMCTSENEYGTFIHAKAPEGKRPDYALSKRWVTVRLNNNGKTVDSAIVNGGLHATGGNICIIWPWGQSKPRKVEYEDFNVLAADLLEEVELSRESIHYRWTEAYYGGWTPDSTLFPVP